MPDAAKTLAVELVTNFPTFTAEVAAATASVREFGTVSGAAGKEAGASMALAAKEAQTLTAANRALAVSEREVQAMASAKATSLKNFSAEAAQLARPFTAFSSAGREGIATMDKLATSSSGVIAGMGGATAGAGLLAAGLAVLGLEGTKTYVKLVDEARGLQRAMGGPIEDASRLAAAARVLNVDIDSLDTRMFKLRTNLAEHPALLQKWGVELAHTHTGAVDMIGTLENLGDRFRQLANTPDQAAFLKEFFGARGGFQDMARLLGISRSELQALFAEADKHHELFHESDKENVRKYEEEIGKLKGAWEGAVAQLGKDVVPALISLAEALIPVIEGIGTAIGWIDDLAAAWGKIPGPLRYLITTATGGLTVGLELISRGHKSAAAAAIEQGSALGGLKADLQDYADVAGASGEKQAILVQAILDGGHAAGMARQELIALIQDQQYHADVLKIVTDEANGNKQAIKEQAEAAKDAAEITKIQADETRKLADLNERAADNTRALARADQEVAKSREGLADATRKQNDLHSFGLADEQAKLEIAAARSTMDHAKAVTSLADAEQKLADLQSFGLEREHERNVRALETATRDYASATQATADAESKLADLRSFGLAEEVTRNDIAATRTRMDLAKATRDEADAQQALNDLQSGGLADTVQRAQDQAVKTANDLARAKRDEISAQTALNDVTAKYADTLERADIAAERGRMRLEDSQSRLADLQAHLRDLQDPNTSIALSDEARQKEILKTQHDIAAAQLDIRDATLTAKDSEAALNTERTSGLATATADAEQKLADARMRVFDATIAARNAQRVLVQEGATGARTLEDAQLKVAEAQLRVREAALASTDAQRVQAREGVTGQNEVRAATDAVNQAKDRAKQALDAEADATRTLTREQQTQAEEMQAAQTAVREAQLKVTESAIAERTAQRDLNTAWSEGGKLAEMVRQGTDAVSAAEQTVAEKIDAVNKLERESGKIAGEMQQAHQTAAEATAAVWERAAQRWETSIAKAQQDVAALQAAGDALIAHFAPTGNVAADAAALGGAGSVGVGGQGAFAGANAVGGSSGTSGAGRDAYGNPTYWANDPRYTGNSAPSGNYGDTTAFAAGGDRIGPGFMTNGPTYIVGEGRPSYPEYVLATDPQYGPRNKGLWMEAGQKLGMLAGGGTLDDILGQLPKPVGIAPDDHNLLDRMIAVTEAASWKAAADAVRRKRDQMAAATTAHRVSTTTFDTSATPSLFGGGSVPAGSVKDWLTQALNITGEPIGWLSDLYDIAMHESSGDPHSKNDWDSNARAGNPSEGLMQTTISTFNEHKLAGHDDIWNPVDNAIAAIRYIVGRYGSPANTPGIKAERAGGRYTNYAMGGVLDQLHMGVMDRGGMLLPGWNLNYNGTSSPERVSPPGGGGNVTLVVSSPLVSIAQHNEAGVDAALVARLTREIVEPGVKKGLDDVAHRVTMRLGL